MTGRRKNRNTLTGDGVIVSEKDGETSECKKKGTQSSEEGNGEECHCKDCAYL